VEGKSMKNMMEIVVEDKCYECDGAGQIMEITEKCDVLWLECPKCRGTKRSQSTINLKKLAEELAKHLGIYG